MARNGSGVQSSPGASYPAVASTLIESAKYNAVVDDINSVITTSLAADGQTTVTGSQNMNTFKHTNIGNGTARTDNTALGQLQDAIINWVAAGGTADAITATYIPAITTLVDGQVCCFRASGANTLTNPTFSPNGLTARTIYRFGDQALVAGDIRAANHEVLVKYHLSTTRWELLNPATVVAATTATNQSGGTVAATTMAYTSTLTGGTGIVNIGTGQVYKDASGYVGIGTSSPASFAAKLVVNNGINKNITFRGSIRLAGSSIQSIQDNAVTDSPLEIYVGTAQLQYEAGFYTWVINGIEKIRIDTSGNLGIGNTPSGAYKLEVTGAVGVSGASTLAAVSATTIAASGLISANGGQIAFPAIQVPSANVNTLDDYEEGTFTGTLSTGLTTTPTLPFAYVKVGNQVTITKTSSSYFSGNSNATTKTMTGIPVRIRPAKNSYFLYFGLDNGGALTVYAGQVSIVGDGIDFYAGAFSTSLWTASGVASIVPTTITYII